MSERDLTEGALGAHLRAMAAPAALGMLFTTLYNIVDAYYAGWISTEAQAGLAVAYVVFMLTMAFGIGLNMGAGALIGGALGARDRDRARALAAGAIGAAAALAVCLAALGWLFAGDLLALMGAGADVRAAAELYLDILFFGLPGFIVGFTANGALTAQGDTVSNRKAQSVAFAANIGLNPLLMYGALGAPGLGFAGIAWATVLIQTGVAVWLVRRALASRAMAGVGLAEFRPTAGLALDLARQSAPATVNIGVMMAGSFIMQTHLQPFGAAAVAGFGIAFRVEQLILLPILAISLSLMPIVAQNYGAGNHDRVRQAVTLALTAAIGFALIGAVALALGGVALTRVFTGDPAAVASGAAYLRMAALMMPAYAAMFAINSFFQGVRRPEWSTAIGLYRQIFALAVYPALFVAYTDWGLAAVWAGLFAAVWSGFLLAALLAFRVGARAIGGLSPDFGAVRSAAP